VNGQSSVRGRRIPLDQTVGSLVGSGPREGHYRLGHRPVGLDEPLWQSGVRSGSMYSQAYISADGVGGRRSSIAPYDRVD